MTTAEISIQCSHCNFNGTIEDHSKPETDKKKAVFRHRGHNPFTGYMHYQCPSCANVLLIEPMDILTGKVLKGYPLSAGQPGKSIMDTFSFILHKLPAVKDIMKAFAEASAKGIFGSKILQ